MSTERHERQFQAYQALKDLSDVAADTMKQIAYDRFDEIDWGETCRVHRAAFEKWISYAETQGAEPGPPRSERFFEKHK